MLPPEMSFVLHFPRKRDESVSQIKFKKLTSTLNASNAEIGSDKIIQRYGMSHACQMLKGNHILTSTFNTLDNSTPLLCDLN